MYRIFGTPGKLYEAFLTFDRQAAEQTQARGCACGGRLDRADYPRKPRGGPAGLHDAYQRRFSFCCAVEGCRRRSTPPSMRFLGRRVYLGVVVVLAAAIRSGLAPRHVRYLREATGGDLNIDRRTLARWVAWWRERLPQSPFWQTAKADLMPPVCPSRLPASLLEHASRTSKSTSKPIPGPIAAIESVLRFLAPVTIGPLVIFDEGGMRPAEDAN